MIRATERDMSLYPGHRPHLWHGNLERAAAVIAESELDGLLLDREAGDMAAVVAMGTATGTSLNGSCVLFFIFGLLRARRYLLEM